MKTEAETEAIIDAVLQDLDAQCSSFEQYNHDDHQRRRHAVRKYGRAFARRMNAGKPFQSADQACKSLAPIVVWGLWKAASMFAEWAIRRMWERWHEQTQPFPPVFPGSSPP